MQTVPPSSLGRGWPFTFRSPPAVTRNVVTRLTTAMTYTTPLDLNSLVQPNAATANIAYDAVRRLMSVTSPHGAVTTCAYTNSPPAATVTTNVRWTKTTMDGLGRTVRVDFTYDQNPFDGSYTENFWGRRSTAHYHVGEYAFTEMYRYTPGGLATKKKLQLIYEPSWQTAELEGAWAYDNEAALGSPRASIRGCELKDRCVSENRCAEIDRAPRVGGKACPVQGVHFHLQSRRHEGLPMAGVEPAGAASPRAAASSCGACGSSVSIEPTTLTRLGRASQTGGDETRKCLCHIFPGRGWVCWEAWRSSFAR